VTNSLDRFSTSMIIAPPHFMEFPDGSAPILGAQRDPNLVGPGGIRVFDIGLEALDLALSTDPVRSGRTIARLKDLRLTVMSLKRGSTVMSHKTDHEISIQTITGRVVIHTAQGEVDLPSGRVAVLDRDTVHDIEAVLASAILITVSVSSRVPLKSTDNDPAAVASLRRRRQELALAVWSDDGGEPPSPGEPTNATR
jgi:quercetin dioxygenase-like cupin family protein